MTLDEECDQINAICDKTTRRVAIDSGAVKHILRPTILPCRLSIVPNSTGKHFSGAGGEAIERFGECITVGPSGVQSASSRR